MGAILALVLGSMWVLLPSLFPPDVAGRIAEAEVVEGATGPRLDVRLPVVEGDVDEMAKAFAARLEAEAIAVERVKSDGDDVLVLLTPGTDPAKVEEIAARPEALPGRFGPAVQAPQAQAAEPEEPAAAVRRPPPWLAGMMPDTRINLGLDLQGGIDMTLQVDVDEAVLGQVRRDALYLKDTAAKEGLVLESVVPSRVDPSIAITSDAPLADVQTFVRSRQPDYVYESSQGRTHTFAMTEARSDQVHNQSVDQVLETLRKRVDATGVREPSIVKKSGGKINVQLPGMVDVRAAADALGTTAVLEFRMVDEEFDDALLDQLLQAAEDALPPDQYADDDTLNQWLWDTDRLDDDRMVLWEYRPDEAGKDARSVALPLVSDVVLTGNDVNDANVNIDMQNQQTYVTLEFKPRGGQIFCDITGKAVGKRFAIILDDKIQSAPSIREQICGNNARIEMSSAEDPRREAQSLALVLRTGSLDAPVVIASMGQVGASLGADATRQGTIGALLGGAIVFLYMVVWYRTAGFVANMALTINVLLVLACLALFGATLTLPGIAGIALTVGMAVDANIIVYERIREELKLGVQARKAVDVGFEKALLAILDANITTAIAGVVLYSYGTGPIKGFAVTLLVGIGTTLLTALFVSRTLLDQLTRSSAARLSI
jgi:preprotein translocase subunit SecD